MRYFLGLLLGLFPALVLKAQVKQTAPVKGIVKGRITDGAASQPLAFATVLVLRAKDSVQVTGARSTQEGLFSAGPLPAGHYLLKISYLGYQTLDTAVDCRFSGPAEDEDLGTLSLELLAHTLASVEVTADRPAMQMNGDTLTFSPTAYKTETDATAEDLIKKIPALQTDDNGNIKSQGKAITKVLVDGKPFFEGNSKDALKMIPASILEKIEVLNDPDQEYDASDPEKPRVLNLVIKKDKKKGYYVNGYASAGNRGQANGRARTNLIRGEKMLAVRAEGNKGVQDSYNYSLRPFYRNYVNDKFSYRIGLRYDRNTNDNYGITRKQNFFADTSYYVNQSNNSSALSNTYWLGGGFEYNPNKRMRIRFWQSFNKDQKQTNNYNAYTYTDEQDSLLTEGFRRNTGQDENPGMSSNLNFIYRFKRKGQRLETNLSYDRGNGTNTATVYALRSNIKESNTDTTDQTKIQRKENNGLRFRVNYITPLLSERSSLNIGYNVSLGNNLNDYSSYQNEKDALVFDTSLSNIYRNHDYNHNLSADYSIHLNSFRYRLGIGYQRILTHGVNYLKDSSYTSKRFSLSPRGGIKYEFDEHNDVALNYDGSLKPPTFEQLQPTINNTDPQHIRKGNPALKPEFSSRFRLRFNRYNTHTMSTLNVNLGYQLYENQIQQINTFDTATGVITTQPQNVPTNYQMNGNIDYVFFLNKKSSVNLHSNASYNSFIQRYNQTDYTSSINANTGNVTIQQEMDGNLRLGGGFKYYVNIKDWLFFSGGSDVDFSTFTSGVTIKGGLTAPQGEQYYNMHSDFDTEVEFPWDIKYGIYVNYSKQSNLGDAALNGYDLVVVNSAVTKRLFDKKGSLSLRVNDITNNIAKRNEMIDPDFVKNSPFADLTRYYTLSFSYTINKLGDHKMRHRED